MDIRQNPLWLSIPSGRWFGTEVRFSVWLVLIGILLCFSLPFELGLILTSLFVLSLLVHEFAHVLAARGTGGEAHEIIVWPLGGLVAATPGSSFAAELWTILAGPLANGLVCLGCLPFVASAGKLAECCSWQFLPNVDLAGDLLHSVVLLLFWLNLKLVIINLVLPIFPLDSWHLAFAVSKIYWDRQTAKVGALWVGLVTGIVLILAGWYLESLNVVLIASVLFSLCQYEFFVTQVSRSFDDSFMGYDFSQGYTSLEGDEERDGRRRPGVIESWRQQRAERKRQLEVKQRLETERRLDELLEKVHQQGMSSLTADERRFLHRASSQYRSPEKD